MGVTLIRSTRLCPVSFAYAAAGGETGLVYTSGAMPIDTEGNVTAPGDLAAQTRQALANLQIMLHFDVRTSTSTSSRERHRNVGRL